MIFNDDFNKIVYFLCDLDDDFCKGLLKMKEKVPKKYLKQTRAVTNINSNEDIYHIYLNHTQHKSCDEMEFVFGISGVCYRLHLIQHTKFDLDKQTDNLNRKAQAYGSKLNFERGFYLGEFEIYDDVKSKRVQFFAQLRQAKKEQYLDMLKVLTSAGKISIEEMSYNKIYNENLFLN